MKKLQTIKTMLAVIVLAVLCACNKTDDPNNGGGNNGGGNDNGNTYNGHEYVDLGLPSGTLWATCNVGATTPEGYGNYYAWGETQPKSYYDFGTYKYCEGTPRSLTKYCHDSDNGYNGFTDNLTELQPIDDAATANWGSGWVMPTVEQFEELLQYTVASFTFQNGVKGILLTANNNNSLFLPAAGHYFDEKTWDVGVDCNYWSSSLDMYPGDSHHACSLLSDNGDYCRIFKNYRDYGYIVRPVRSK